MCSSICSDRGFSITEVIVAILLVSVGVIALLATQPSSWNLAGRSDNLGRAAGILQSELSLNEAVIMNPLVAIPASQTKNVYVSRQGERQPGDAPYTVTTTIDLVSTGVWRVRATVTWPSNSTGITDSIIVTRQEPYRY
ncbi:MAG: prepilin-type N-terminal cleavage/methylation domain-containing protein [Syntrophaceae bacterium]